MRLGSLGSRASLSVMLLAALSVMVGCGDNGESSIADDVASTTETTVDDPWIQTISAEKCNDLLVAVYGDYGLTPDAASPSTPRMQACRQEGFDPVYESHGLETREGDYWDFYGDLTTTTVVPTIPPQPPTQPPSTAPPATAASSGAVMPNVVCMNLQDAQDTIQAAGVFFSRSHDATGADRSQIIDSNWVVVSQSPGPGTPIGELEADLGAVKYGEPSQC